MDLGTTVNSTMWYGQHFAYFVAYPKEPKTDKDEENCKKVNETLNNPPTPGSSLAGGRGGLPAELAGLSANLGKVLTDSFCIPLLRAIFIPVMVKWKTLLSLN